MNFETFNTVSSIGSITVVGESHGYMQSKELVARVIEQEAPAGIAIERYPNSLFLGEGGMKTARRYACSMGHPLLAMDNDYEWLSERLPADVESVVSTANRLQDNITPLGDIDRRSVTQSRNAVRDEFGDKAYRVLYVEREKQMAARLKRFDNMTDRNVLAVVGAFHVQSIKDLIPVVDAEQEISDRITEYGDHIYETLFRNDQRIQSQKPKTD